MKAIIIITLMVIATNSFSQQTDTLTRADYLQKSKGQKVGGFILLGLGAAMIAIAAPGNVSFDVLPFLAIGGAGGVLGSIPLFLASSKNKQKAMRVSAFFELEKTQNLQANKITFKRFPALSLKINL